MWKATISETFSVDKKVWKSFRSCERDFDSCVQPSERRRKFLSQKAGGRKDLLEDFFKFAPDQSQARPFTFFFHPAIPLSFFPFIISFFISPSFSTFCLPFFTLSQNSFSRFFLAKQMHQPDIELDMLVKLARWTFRVKKDPKSSSLEQIMVAFLFLYVMIMVTWTGKLTVHLPLQDPSSLKGKSKQKTRTFSLSKSNLREEEI